MESDPVYAIFLERTAGHQVGSEFPSYFEETYGADAESMLDTALKNDHLIVSRSVEDNMNASTVVVLKEALKEHGLKASGRKSELIDRLVSNLDTEDLESVFSDSYYALSDEGKEIVNENEHAIYYHKTQALHGEIDLIQYDEIMKSRKDGSSKSDVALELVRLKAESNRTDDNWGLYRNSLLAEAKVLEEMDDGQSVLDLLLRICCIDSSGLGNGNRYEPSSIMLYPGTVYWLEEVKERMDVDDDDLRARYHFVVDNESLPRTRFTEEESFVFIMDSMGDNLDSVNERIKELTENDPSEDMEEVQEPVEEQDQLSSPEEKEGFLKRLLRKIKGQ